MITSETDVPSLDIVSVKLDMLKVTKRDWEAGRLGTVNTTSQREGKRRNESGKKGKEKKREECARVFVPFLLRV